MRITQDQVSKQQTFSNVFTASPGDPKQHQPQRPPCDEDAGKRATCIIDIRTSENPQPRIEGKLDSLTKGVADIPSKVCDEFMKVRKALQSLSRDNWIPEFTLKLMLFSAMCRK